MLQKKSCVKKSTQIWEYQWKLSLAKILADLGHAITYYLLFLFKMILF
jgi:hypothetical protein